MNLKHFNSSDESRILRVVDFALDESPRLPYHNIRHHLDVCDIASKNGLSSGISYSDQLALELAALGHDLVHDSAREDNEERSFDKIRPVLYDLGFPEYVVSTAGRLIVATKMPVSPKDHLEGIICDADTDNVGRDDFFLRGEELRREYALHGREFTSKGWAVYSLNFLRRHKFFTPFAQNLRNAKKKENVVELLRRLS